MPDNTIETAIWKSLTDEATISAIISARLYPMIAPQDAALPFMVYQQISGDRDYVLAGPSGLTHSRYQLNCWATTPSGAKLLFEAVRIFWDGFSGTVLNRVIQLVMFENELDRFEKTVGVDQLDIYGKQVDFKISFREPTS